MIRGILFLDSSIHNILCQIVCTSPTELEVSGNICPVYKHLWWLYQNVYHLGNQNLWQYPEIKYQSPLWIEGDRRLTAGCFFWIRYRLQFACWLLWGIYIYIFLLQKLEVNIIHFLWALYCFEITFFSDCYFYIIIAYVCIRMFLLCRTPGWIQLPILIVTVIQNPLLHIWCICLVIRRLINIWC